MTFEDIKVGDIYFTSEDNEMVGIIKKKGNNYINLEIYSFVDEEFYNDRLEKDEVEYYIEWNALRPIEEDEKKECIDEIFKEK